VVSCYLNDLRLLISFVWLFRIAELHKEEMAKLESEKIKDLVSNHDHHVKVVFVLPFVCYVVR
jgi:hypothetical protein